MSINPHLRIAIEKFVRGYEGAVLRQPFRSELDYIRKTLLYFNTQNIGPSNQRIVTQSSEIHGTPLVEFFSQWTNSLDQVELGDLVFVFKHFINQNLVTKRALLVQCKFTKTTRYNWNIQQNQFDFLSTFPTFRFSKPSRSKRYNINPKAISWAMYGLGANQIPITPIYQPAKRILKNRTGRPWVKTKFAYGVNPIRGWDSSHSFLLRLMQGRLGENLINNPAADDLIRDLYIAVHLTPDPPDDMVFDKINSTSPEKGIGLIEIKIVENGFDSQ